MRIDEMYVLTSVAFFIWALRSIFYWVTQWQKLSSGTLQIRSSLISIIKVFFSPFSVISWVGIIFSFYITFTDFPLIYYQSFIFFIFTFKAVFTVIDLGSGKIRVPKFTWQNSIISSLAVILAALVMLLPLTERYLWLLLVDRMLFFFVALPVFLILFPSEIFEDIQLKRAAQYAKKFKKIQSTFIIGENANEVAYFINQILKKNKNILIIENQFLRPSFVAKSLLNNVSSQTELIFIVIPKLYLPLLISISKIITPKFVIFLSKDSKSIQKVLHGLDMYLPKSTSVIIDQSLKSTVNNKKRRILTFSSETDIDHLATISMESVIQKKDELKMILRFFNQEIIFKAPLIGKHYGQYLLPGILFSRLVGMTQDDLSISQNNINPLPGRLVAHTLHSGVVIVDATRIKYKAEASGALEYLKAYHKERVVIFGIGEEISTAEIRSLKAEFSIPSLVIVLAQKHQSLIRRLIRVGTGKSEVIFNSEGEIIHLVSEKLSRGDVLLLLGKESGNLIESILLSTRTLS